MIDLTPLDVRNKRGDFRRAMRGYEPDEVNTFLELVAERLENLVRENLQLRERTENLASQVDTQAGREKAVQEALVTAQELRADIRTAAEREAELTLSEARSAAKRILTEAEGEAKNKARDIEERIEQGKDALEDLERTRLRFLKNFRQLLQRELDVVEMEVSRIPEKEDSPIDLDLGARRREQQRASEARAAQEQATKVDTTEPSAVHEEEPRTSEPVSASSAPDPTDQAVADLEAMREALATAATDIGRLAPESEAEQAVGDAEASEDHELFALPDIPSGGEGRREDPRRG
jgi:cell division initiation protein